MHYSFLPHPTILNDKLEKIKCITDNKDFEILCLNKTVLDTALVQLRRNQKKFDFTVKKISNRFVLNVFLMLQLHSSVRHMRSGV